MLESAHGTPGWVASTLRRMPGRTEAGTVWSEDALHCCCSSHGGFVQTSSGTLRDIDGIQETTHNSYDSRTGQQQSLHSRQLPNRVRSNTLSHEIFWRWHHRVPDLMLPCCRRHPCLMWHTLHFLFQTDAPAAVVACRWAKCHKTTGERDLPCLECALQLQHCQPDLYILLSRGIQSLAASMGGRAKHTSTTCCTTWIQRPCQALNRTGHACTRPGPLCSQAGTLQASAARA